MQTVVGIRGYRHAWTRAPRWREWSAEITGRYYSAGEETVELTMMEWPQISIRTVSRRCDITRRLGHKWLNLWLYFCNFFSLSSVFPPSSLSVGCAIPALFCPSAPPPPSCKTRVCCLIRGSDTNLSRKIFEGKSRCLAGQQGGYGYRGSRPSAGGGKVWRFFFSLCDPANNSTPRLGCSDCGSRR